ncbi:unnamed protein product [Ilex paraguariensis]|uniref:Uncharacterized protein n=1 Tax=Ilex paraguariensis TaxID=185542 RepID=A0ABC8TQZ8_9AQUA
MEQNNAAIELINSVTGADEEGRSRQRILTFAAKRYASAIDRNPDDYDALYNWALVLQESADNVSPDSSSPSKDALLEEACRKYDEATHLCPTLHDAYYNWAIAISDRAKMRGRTKEAEELWKQATKNYEKAVQLNWNSPQALNNWGLALQELSAIVAAREKQTIVKTAISKFRAAIQLQFDFHRAIYNLGTVLYGLAEDMSRTGGSFNAKEVPPNELYSQSAIYIAAAHALKPNYSATKNYEKAVQLNWNSPQALNNWGLALQELSAIVAAREKQTIVKTAISKFRAAIQLQFDFHRAIYNLGTVLYGLAEDMSRTGGSFNAKEVPPNELYSQSAIYIAAAHALKPNYSVYTSALKLVRSMLPLPYLKVGYLTAPPVGNPIAPHSDWRRSEFVLNHEGLQQINKVEQRQITRNLSSKSGDTMNFSRPAIKVDVADIVSVAACADLTLPPGAGLCIDTIHGPILLVADSWEYLDGWLDAIRLVYTIFARSKTDVLAGIITG